MAARENRENVNLIFSQNMAYRMSFLGSLDMKSLFFYSVLKTNFEDGHELCFIHF